MSSSFSFPLLSNADILSCLEELGSDIREQELLRPTYEVLRPIYENLVMLLVGLTREEIHQPMVMAMDGMDYPEMHEDSIATMQFNKALMALLKGSGVLDFTLKDLHKPEYMRTRRNLSAIINFAKFREEKLAFFNELQEQSEALVEQKQKMMDKNVELKAALRELEEKGAAEKDQVITVKTECAGLESAIDSMNNEQASLQDEVRKMKMSGSDLADEATKLNSKLSDLESEANCLRGQIVQSPEKMKRALDELDVSLANEKCSASEIETRRDNLHMRLDCMNKVEKDIMKCIQLMEEAEGTIGKKKEVSHAIKALNVKSQESEEASWTLNAEHQHLERQLQIAKSRLQRLSDQASLKKETRDAMLKSAIEDKEEADKEKKLSLIEISKGAEKMKEIRKSIIQDKENHEKLIDFMMDKYNDLLMQVQRYHDEMATVMATEST